MLPTLAPLLASLTSLPLLLGGASTPTATTVAAQSGGKATLQVMVATKDILLSRDAPNRLTLNTPWGKVQATPTGTPHRAPEFADYFAQVRPLTLSVTVPAGTKAGSYAGQLDAQLFVCDKVEKMCVPRTLRSAVRLNVGSRTAAGRLTLQDSHLRSRRTGL